ncbi:hypothetical protein GCM10009676_18370 [Prauserella halophila]|uniref:Uncharacterized protein n=1 Tax=Prauserella halophila TaxID=185641 RepID=A0ABN1W8H1_9PSEU|nr:hypothetical protein [Prauserella halophila]MCP2235960.1 hypothetical protein [Prauserella halophila]
MTTIPTRRLYTGWFLAIDDEHEHAVTDEEFSRTRAGGGLPEAVCGHAVSIASCMSPPGPHCHRCERYLAARETFPDLATRLDPGRHVHRKPSLLRRLFRAG